MRTLKLTIDKLLKRDKMWSITATRKHYRYCLFVGIGLERSRPFHVRVEGGFLHI